MCLESGEISMLNSARMQDTRRDGVPGGPRRHGDKHLIHNDKVRSSSEATLTQPSIRVAHATAALRLVGKTLQAGLNIQS
jgi:hypothetical protein